MASMLGNMENNQQNPTNTPGWNDPPPSNTIHNPTTAGNNNRLHLQRLRRPIDPSVQGNPFQSSTQLNGPKLPQHELSAPSNVHFHQSRSFPQLHNPSPIGIGTHHGSAFSPTSATTTQLHNSSQSQTSLISNQNYFAANPPTQMATIHHPHPSMLATSPPSIAPNLTPQPLPTPMQSIPLPANPAAIIQQSDAAVLGHHYDTNSVQQNHPPHLPTLPNTNSTGGIYIQGQLSNLDPASKQMPQNPNSGIATMAEEPTNGHNNSIIFSPPNIVPLKGLDQQCRPTTQPVPTDYRIPVKAAGDVSLSGGQLVAFLTKATLILPQGPMREGIQLRINQFGEFVQAGQISEPCLKKLNFVVDAIDRHIYAEAWQFSEQMLAAYPTDCALGGWAHGVRLLIQELRKGGPQVPNRAHSAGARQHF